MKDEGIPYIIAEAYDKEQGRVLEKVGVDRVIYSEQEMGVHLANNLAFNHLVDAVELSSDYTIAEIKLPPSWEGKNLGRNNDVFFSFSEKRSKKRKAEVWLEQ